MFKLKRKYRIVTDAYAGYEAQVKYSFLPIWITVGSEFINTHTTIEAAEKSIKMIEERRLMKSQAGIVVKVITHKPCN